MFVVVGFETDHLGLICYTITHIKRRLTIPDPIMSIRLAAVLFALATSASAEAPHVATDILPVHSLVARVMQGVGTPDLILPPGASPHGYAMRPSEAAALERADIVFWIGPELTPWLAGPIATLASDAKINALLEQDETVLADAHDHDDQDHGDVDPHAWLDPENGRVWLGHIAEILATIDPDNAVLYRANAKAAQSETTKLTKSMQTAVAPLRARNFAVYHDAFGYLETRFGIEPSFSLLSSEADNPTPRRIAEIRKRAQTEDISLIITEPQSNVRLIETVFEGVGVSSCQVDILGADIVPGPNHYWSLLQNLADTLGTCGAASVGVD